MRILLLALFLTACGGEFKYNRNAGDRSPLAPTLNLTARQLFDESLYPLMRGSIAGKTCVSSGCHATNNNPSNAAQVFFKVDPTSADNTWNWVSVRRKSVNTTTGYADGTSKTLVQRIADNHIAQNGGWSASDLDLLQEWNDLSE